MPCMPGVWVPGPGEHCGPTPDGPAKTVKVMAIVILIAVPSGTLGALLAFVLTRHLDATALVARGSAGVTFLASSAR